MKPPELVEIPQWVGYVLEYRIGTDKATKPPINPHTGRKANVRDPTTWSTHEQACALVQTGKAQGIGFVLTPFDPYAFVDIDSVQNGALGLVDKFHTYTEISPSGQGLHMIVRGAVPTGRKRPGLEVYSQYRYMTMTGNVWPEYRPIVDCNGYLLELWQSMGPESEITAHREGEEPLVMPVSLLTDGAVYDMAARASNGAKFLQLWAGQWQGAYSSQSEGDQALTNILRYWTKDYEQFDRLFHGSGLGKREKAYRVDYLKGLWNKASDRELPEIRIASLPPLQVAQAPPVVVEPIAPPVTPPSQFTYTWPPGLVGGIAQYIYVQSPKPTVEVSLAAALSLMAGICGRNFNVFGGGLNLYVIVVADSGIGKEAGNSGISSLEGKIEGLDKFIGPSKIESGQGLRTHVNNHPCSVILQDEFGLVLKNLASKYASATEVRIRSELLEFYGLSGVRGKTHGSARSKLETSTPSVVSPSVSLYCFATPVTYQEAITEESIEQGLIPRFITIVHDNPIQDFSFGFKAVDPSDELVGQLTTLVAYVNKLSTGNEPLRRVSIGLNAEAQDMCTVFETLNNKQANNADGRGRVMFTRATMKALKVAALVAIGMWGWPPIITGQIMEWAIELIKKDTQTIVGWLDRGETGDPANLINQGKEMRRIIWELSKGDPNVQILHRDIRRRCERVRAFYKAGTSAQVTAAIWSTLDSLVQGDELIKVEPEGYHKGAVTYFKGKLFQL